MALKLGDAASADNNILSTETKIYRKLYRSLPRKNTNNSHSVTEKGRGWEGVGGVRGAFHFWRFFAERDREGLKQRFPNILLLSGSLPSAVGATQTWSSRLYDTEA